MEVEDLETNKAMRAARYEDDAQPMVKKSKVERRDAFETTFDKDAFQRMLVNSTYAGLEDLLITKTNAKKA